MSPSATSAAAQDALSQLDQQILHDLETASAASDVARLIKTHGYEPVAALWGRLSPVQRGALALCRNTGGTIIHELNNQNASLAG